MSTEINDAAFNALNEVLIVYGVQPIPERHYLRQHLDFWLNADAKAKQPKSTTKQAEANVWLSRISTEFVGAARNVWQVLGLDADGNLWCRVINVHDRFTGKAVKFDRRMRPKAIPSAQDFHYFVRFLQESGDDTSDLRNEMKLTTEGLF